MKKWLLILWVGVSTFIMFYSYVSAFDKKNKAIEYKEKTEEVLKDLENYKTWTRANKTPRHFSSLFDSADCAFLGPVQALDPKSPHKDKYILVYVNDIGRNAMMHQKKPRFPKGSVIVKEKLSTKNSETPELLTVMIKREKGYDTKNGNWEYMVVNSDATKVQARGKLKDCQTCHKSQEYSDFIFRSYIK
jgi:hypothetical protein